MPNQCLELDRVFHGLASATRRQVIEALALGPASVTQLARRTPMALPSFMQHLSVLEGAGLVVSNKTGRVRSYELCAQNLLEAENWLDARRAQWTARFDQLDHLLISLKENPTE